MPFGNNDWLALTQEDPIEPDIPLCDPHHHFWDGRMQSIPYQRYLLHELMADLDSGHNVTWSPDPEIENRETPGIMADESFRAGARVLASMGLSLDIMLAFPQLNEVAEFAQAVPEVSIILNHLGGVSRTGIYAGKDDEIVPAWREGIAAVARNPNVTCKLGGMGMPRWGFDWPYRNVPIGSEELAEGMAPWMNYAIEQFGPDRCMFESNFPPDKVSFSYNVMYNAFKRLSQGYSASERAAMLHDTAVRVYRIET